MVKLLQIIYQVLQHTSLNQIKIFLWKHILHAPVVSLFLYCFGNIKNEACSLNIQVTVAPQPNGQTFLIFSIFQMRTTAI